MKILSRLNNHFMRVAQPSVWYSGHLKWFNLHDKLSTNISQTRRPMEFFGRTIITNDYTINMFTPDYENTV